LDASDLCSYKVTIYEEAGSLLVTAEAPEGATVPQKLIMQEQHFQVEEINIPTPAYSDLCQHILCGTPQSALLSH
jgi:hypothetical protein